MRRWESSMHLSAPLSAVEKEERYISVLERKGEKMVAVFSRRFTCARARKAE